MKISKYLHRIAALLCVLVVAVSILGVSVPYYASTSTDVVDINYNAIMENQRRSDVPEHDMDELKKLFFETANYSKYSHKDKYIILYDFGNGGRFMCLIFAETPYLYFDSGTNFNTLKFGPKSNLTSAYVTVNSDGSLYMGYPYYNTVNAVPIYGKGTGQTVESFLGCVLETNCDVYVSGDENYILFPAGNNLNAEKYDSSIGYLQNVKRKSTYIRGALYNYDEDSLTYHWYHDLTSTSGVDLSSGDYVVRHYVSNATVTGYKKEDIVEMSDKFYMADYDASQGYFSYLDKDYTEKLEMMGYEYPNFIDTVFKGHFVLQHHYLQIVNISTNEVGGYLHFYPKDAKGDSWFTDYVDLGYEGVDNNFDVDPDGPNGIIENIVGSGTTVEDALQNADEPKLGELSGVDEVVVNLEAYASQVESVSSGLGALFSMFPPWMLGLLGLSVALTFILIGVKAVRG